MHHIYFSSFYNLIFDFRIVTSFCFQFYPFGMYRNDITVILLKVVLNTVNTITLTPFGVYLNGYALKCSDRWSCNMRQAQPV